MISSVSLIGMNLKTAEAEYMQIQQEPEVAIVFFFFFFSLFFFSFFFYIINLLCPDIRNSK